MKKVLVALCLGAFALSVFAAQKPVVNTMPNIDSLMAIHKSTFDSIFKANLPKMDSLLALHQAMIQSCRLEALKAFDSLKIKIKANLISKDSLDKILDARRAVAKENLKLAIGDLQALKDSVKVRIQKASEELQNKLADREKNIKGGIETAIARLDEAKAKLEAKKSSADAAAAAKIDEAIKRIDAIEAHLKAVEKK